MKGASFRQSGLCRLSDEETLKQKPTLEGCLGARYISPKKAQGDGTGLVGSRKSAMTSRGWGRKQVGRDGGWDGAGRNSSRMACYRSWEGGGLPLKRNRKSLEP